MDKTCHAISNIASVTYTKANYTDFSDNHTGVISIQGDILFFTRISFINM